MQINNFTISFFRQCRLKVIDLLRIGLIISLLYTFACIPRRTTLDAIYLLPQGYEGVVLIFFDEPDGVELETEGSQYVYKILADGVLRVKNHGQGGLIVTGLRYFYVNENGERQPLEYLYQNRIRTSVKIKR